MAEIKDSESWSAYRAALNNVAEKRVPAYRSAECFEHQYTSTFGDITVEEGFRRLAAKRTPMAEAILRFLTVYLLEYIPPNSRKIALSAISEWDPPVAAVIYQEQANLTDEEDRKLIQAFAPTLPHLAELAMAGKMERAKRG